MAINFIKNLSQLITGGIGIVDDELVFKDSEGNVTKQASEEYVDGTALSAGFSGVNIYTVKEGPKNKGLGSGIFQVDRKWIMWWREGDEHGVDEDAYIKISESTDNGATWTEDEIIYNEAGIDARNGAWAKMNGRLGIILDRRSDEAAQKPLFLYSDDEGDTWQSQIIDLEGLDSFATFHHLLQYPSSAGGDDNNGFICYGSQPSDGNKNTIFLKTTDNGVSWDYGVAIPEEEYSDGENVSEAVVARISDEDKWIMVVRRNTGFQKNAYISRSTNMTDWDPPQDSQKMLGRNPPYIFYNNGKIWFLAPSRHEPNFANYIDNEEFNNSYLFCGANADRLWEGSETFGAWKRLFLGGRERLTGYITLFKNNGDYFGSFCNSEEFPDRDTAQINVFSEAPITQDFYILPNKPE